MSTKHLQARVVKKGGDGPGTWTAIASTEVVDFDGERIARGAFDPLPARIPVHRDHSFKVDNLVGTARPYYEGDQLKVAGTFSSSPAGQAVRELVLEGVLDSMSIAFVEPQRKNISGVPTIVKGKLIACDFVSVGSNPQARLVSARSMDSEEGLVIRARALALQAGLTGLARDIGSAAVKSDHPRVDAALEELKRDRAHQQRLAEQGRAEPMLEGYGYTMGPGGRSRKVRRGDPDRKNHNIWGIHERLADEPPVPTYLYGERVQ